MKKMDNYNFSINFEGEYENLREEFLKMFKENDASNLFYYNEDTKYPCCYIHKDGESEIRAIAVLRNGYVDIEANLEAIYNKKLNKVEPFIAFICCIKTGESEYDWQTDCYYEDVTNDDTWTTDFTKENWESELEKEMFDKLERYCEKLGYDYTKAIQRQYVIYKIN